MSIGHKADRIKELEFLNSCYAKALNDVGIHLEFITDGVAKINLLRELSNKTERMFPIQSSYVYGKPHPTKIPWAVAELAYSVYYAHHKSQTLERLAERGGFGPGEMDMYCPDWIERCDRIAALETELETANKRAENAVVSLQDACERYGKRIEELELEASLVLFHLSEADDKRPISKIAKTTVDRIARLEEQYEKALKEAHNRNSQIVSECEELRSKLVKCETKLYELAQYLEIAKKDIKYWHTNYVNAEARATKLETGR